MASKNRIEVTSGAFSLAHTFGSAQPLTFFGDYDPQTGRLTYPSRHGPISVVQRGDSLIVGGDDAAAAVADVRRRFRLSDDMPSIYSSISTDPFIRDSIRRYDGLRLTLNDPWETTAVFILSQFNNVKRIRLITKRLIDRFGEPLQGEPSLKGFPSAEALSSASERELLDCGTGFRAKYLRSAAAFCSSSLDLESLEGRPYGETKEALLGLDGVGDKVADCIALMGYGLLEAFPIDTWVRRVMERRYFDGRKTGIRGLHEFAYGRWGRLSGYAQLYLFHDGRLGSKRG